MATKTYDEYLADQLAASKKQTDEFAARRKTLAEEAARVSDAFYDAAIETSRKDHEASAKQTEDSYRSVYDANAVNELVMRREIQEAIANMGLTDSGLNATQQTAVSLQRGRADSEATRQKQAAVDAIMRELDRERAQYTAKKTAASHEIFEQADADILSFGNSADEAASKTALSLYEVDREAEAAGSAAGQQEGSDGQSPARQNDGYLRDGYFDPTSGNPRAGDVVAYERVTSWADRLWKNGAFDTVGSQEAKNGLAGYLYAQFKANNLENRYAVAEIYQKITGEKAGTVLSAVVSDDGAGIRLEVLCCLNDGVLGEEMTVETESFIRTMKILSVEEKKGEKQ